MENLRTLGNEPEYYRLYGYEIVQENDEQYTFFGSGWVKIDSSQIGKPAYSVGGFGICRRKLLNENDQ
jgi:hypothetical protein